jgi:hypothetical protein
MAATGRAPVLSRPCTSPHGSAPVPPLTLVRLRHRGRDHVAAGSRQLSGGGGLDDRGHRQAARIEARQHDIHLDVINFLGVEAASCQFSKLPMAQGRGASVRAPCRERRMCTACSRRRCRIGRLRRLRSRAQALLHPLTAAPTSCCSGSSSASTSGRGIPARWPALGRAKGHTASGRAWRHKPLRLAGVCLPWAGGGAARGGGRSDTAMCPPAGGAGRPAPRPHAPVLITVVDQLPELRESPLRRVCVKLGQGRCCQPRVGPAGPSCAVAADPRALALPTPRPRRT